MVNEQGVHITSGQGRCSLKYNGVEVISRLYEGEARYGLYVNGRRLELYNSPIAQSALQNPQLVEKNNGLYFAEVELSTRGKCINISLSDFNRLLRGECVDGYKAYNPDDVYNVIPDGGTAQEISYTKENGVYHFSNDSTQEGTSNIVYNNASAMQDNTEDLEQTVLNTSHPQLFVRYFDPIIAVGDTIEIEYHVDTLTMSALNNDEVEDTFTTIITTASGSTVSKTTYAGMFKIATPAFSTAGETWFSIRCIDSNGVASDEQFFDIWVKESLADVDNPYTMTAEDLEEFTRNGETFQIIPNDDTVAVAIANKAALSAFFANVKADGYNRVIMYNDPTDNDGSGTIYWIDYHQKNGQPDVVYGRNYGGDYIKFPNHFTVDLNGGTFAATQCTNIAWADMVVLTSNVDTHIINGNLKGNYTGFDFATAASILGGGRGVAQWLSIANFEASRYCSFRNLNVSDATGFDCWSKALGKDTGDQLEDHPLTDNTRIDLSTGEPIAAENMVVSGYFEVSGNQLLAFGRNGNGKYLNMGPQRVLFFSFYDTDKHYIKSIKGYAYRTFRVPSGAKYLRITGYGKTLQSGASNDTDWSYKTDNGWLLLFQIRLSVNNKVISCHWSHTRTTAITNPSVNGLLIDGCTYTDIAVEHAYEATDGLGDLEDQWQWGNHITIRNCSCIAGSGSNVLITHYANELEFVNNSNIYIKGYGGIEKGYICGNTMPNFRIEINRSCYYPFVVYDNNKIGNLSIAYGYWKYNPISWTIGEADRVVSMTNTTIRDKCYYADLKLRNSKNGNEYYN